MERCLRNRLQERPFQVLWFPGGEARALPRAPGTVWTENRAGPLQWKVFGNPKWKFRFRRNFARLADRFLQAASEERQELICSPTRILLVGTNSSL